MKPKLSICIPTHNRAEFLAECLESVWLACSGHEDRVEIVVSDNCSEDNTWKIIETFRRKCKSLIAWKNPEDVGGDRNILLAGLGGNGEYVWILGDDDKLRPNAVGAILSRVEKNPDLIVGNFSTHTRFFEREIKSRYYDLREDRCFISRDSVLKTFGIGLGFISSIICKKEALLSVPAAKYEKYYEYGWAFLMLVLLSLPSNCRADYIATPLVCNRLGNSSIPSWVTYFAEGTDCLLAELQTAGYSASAVFKARKKLINDYMLNYILNSKADGNFDARLKGILQTRYSACWNYWLLCRPLMLTPDWLLRFGKLGYRRLRDILTADSLAAVKKSPSGI